MLTVFKLSDYVLRLYKRLKYKRDISKEYKYISGLIFLFDILLKFFLEYYWKFTSQPTFFLLLAGQIICLLQSGYDGLAPLPN